MCDKCLCGGSLVCYKYLCGDFLVCMLQLMLQVVYFNILSTILILLNAPGALNFTKGGGQGRGHY